MTQFTGLRFHHFGLAARQPERALSYLSRLGYECRRDVWDPLQQVRLHWCEADAAPPVEVVSPGPGGAGPLAAILANQGSSFYHLCHELDRPLSAWTEQLALEGIRLVTVRDPLPAVLFGGRLVSFHMVQGFGLVELLHPPEGGIGAEGGG